MSWEVISGICAVIGVIFGVYQFYYLPKAEIKELRMHLLLQFRVNQKLANDLLDCLTGYAILNNKFDQELGPNVTIFSYTLALRTTIEKDLSDKKYEDVKTLPISKSTILSMTKSLESQYENFNNVYLLYTRFDRGSL